MAKVYLGIGSNMGDRQANIERALLLLKEQPEIEVIQVSSIRETEPEKGLSQEKYLNGAIEIQTDLLPLDLLSRLKMIERRLGRQKTPANSPRPMDLDILFYDDVVIVEGRTLSIPHARASKRIFVLQPLAEIAPVLLHPRLGKTIRELYDLCLDANHSAPSSAP